MNGFLLFSEALLFWSVATATSETNLRWWRWGTKRDGMGGLGRAPRAILAALATGIAAWGLSLPNALLVGFVAASTLTLIALRPSSAKAGRLAELEISGVAIYSIGAATLIWAGHLGARLPAPLAHLHQSQLALVCLVSAGLVLSVWQSGHVVDGVLKKNKVRLPTGEGDPTDSATANDSAAETKDKPALACGDHGSTSLRHGQLIGYFERILVVVLVVTGSYEGLGLLVAAKGLVRFTELEKDRRLAEYFLIGTLLSILCAVIIGLALRYALSVLSH